MKKKGTLLALPDTGTYHLVNEKDILYCKSDGNYTNIHFRKRGSLLVCRPLKDVASSLDDAVFVRVHHSYIVNIHHISKYINRSGDRLVLDNDEVISVSRSRKQSLMAKIRFL